MSGEREEEIREVDANGSVYGTGNWNPQFSGRTGDVCIGIAGTQCSTSHRCRDRNP